MQATVVTLFPELFEPFLRSTVVGRAVQAGRIDIRCEALRAHGEGKHQIVDDRPFGGGPGMVLLADPVIRAVTAARERHPAGVRTLLLSPQGRRFDQRMAEELAAHDPGFVLLCGRYEGIDERAVEILAPELVSLGDFVLSGGEAAALAMLDATARLVPGVLGHARSAKEDSFDAEEGLLDHPHYTRPATYEGREVPPVLLSGHHGAVAAWRREQRIERTRTRRPDLYAAWEARQAEEGGA